MTVHTDMTELQDALDKRDWRIIQTYEEELADALETVVRRGASDDELRRLLRGYVTDDRAMKRVKTAARHLRRVKERAS